MISFIVGTGPQWHGIGGRGQPIQSRPAMRGPRLGSGSLCGLPNVAENHNVKLRGCVFPPPVGFAVVGGCTGIGVQASTAHK